MLWIRKKTTSNLDKLSNESVIYKNAITNAPWTLPSVASMFTGLYPSQHGALNEKTKLKESVTTLAERLSNQGYSTALVTQNDGWITPFYGLTRGFDFKIDIEGIIEKALGLHLPDNKKFRKIIRAFSKYLIGYPFLTNKMVKKLMSDMDGPYFIYVHLMDAHLPYEPKSRIPILAFFRRLVFYKSWRQKMQDSWVGENGFSEREIKLLNRLYDQCIKGLDEQIGNILRVLDTETAVVITADHGELIGEQGFVGHQFSFAESLLQVPLLIKVPGLPSKQIDGLFETKDIFYLIRDLAKEGTLNNFYERDYVYGESRELGPVYEKLSRRNSSLSRGGSYLRTERGKYVQNLDGTDMLYRVQEGEEPVTDEGALSAMRELMEMKKKALQMESSL